MKRIDKGVAVASCLVVVMAVVAMSNSNKPQADTNEKPVEVAEDVQNEEVYCQQIQLVGNVKVKEPLQVEYFDVPLSEDIQDHIFNECEKHNIAPEIIIAMIERESQYTIDAIGDNGSSIGLMQIQPKWHQARMDRLGCNDLLNPYQNITVGIDIVAELKNTNEDLYWVLIAYNAGIGSANERIASGDYSDYAIGVVERAAELERK